MRQSNGNVLFLILAGIALFAALTYAVTQSGRGGANTDPETLKIQATEMIQQISEIQKKFDRFYTLGIAEQVNFSTDTVNTSGMIYMPDGSTRTGTTIGVYNSDNGIVKQHPPIELWSGNGVEAAFTYAIYMNSRVRRNSIDLVSSGGDQAITLAGLTVEACREINRQLTGSSDIPVFTTSTPNSRRWERIRRNNDTLNTTNTIAENVNLERIPACHSNSAVTQYWYWDVLRAY